MKIKILKGTNQIGGCITEITSSKNTKIIIDFGEDLPEKNSNKKQPVPIIDGLNQGESKYDAVFITHSHGDHIGLISEINDDIPIYIEEKTFAIHNLFCSFTNQKTIINRKEMFFNKPIQIKDITITPFIVDHSSYNSSMLLVEADNKKVLHTGDYRSHGFKGKIFVDTLKRIGKIDTLITEATSSTRSDGKYLTEEQLSKRAEEIFKNYNQVFILQSSTNIDRITAFYKASIRTNKNFIEDMFTANITSYLRGSIPNPIDFKEVSVWEPIVYRNKKEDFQKKFLEPLRKYKKNESVYNDYAMLVKTSMIKDIKLLQEKGYVKNACLIHSMWKNYLTEYDVFIKFANEVEKLGIDILELHTSGHADIPTMKKVEEITNPDKVIIIHTSDKVKSRNIFVNDIKLDDNEEVEV